MVAWALPLAPTMCDPEALAASVVEELRRRSRPDLISYETERPASGGRAYDELCREMTHSNFLGDLSPLGCWRRIGLQTIRSA